MDWDFAIERNREPLLHLVMGLFAQIGLTEDGAIERLPRPVYRLVLSVLRRAEAAVRRLIVVMARDIVVKPRRKRPFPAGHVIVRNGAGKAQVRLTSFKLFDPPKHVHEGKARRHAKPKFEPRARFIDLGYDPRIPLFRQSQPAAAMPAPVVEKDRVADDTVNALPLCRRLFAIRYALEDLQRQAKRLARWLAEPFEERRPRRERPLRLGWPPGWRIKSTHEVDEILKECHWLVRSLPALDTS